MTTTETSANYRGMLFLIGQNQTPFIRMIGSNPRYVNSYQFPVNQNYSLNAASQNVTDETNAAGAQTATTYTRGQVYNVVQIMKYDVKVTYLKQSSFNQFSGININDDDIVPNEHVFQREAAMKQFAIDYEYSCINGTFVDYADDDTAMKTRGMMEAVSTNATAAGGATLSRDLLEGVLQKMYDAGAPMSRPVIFVNSFQKRQISDIYGYAPDDRNYGGVNIKTIETDFGVIGVVLTPQMTTSNMLIADIDYCSPVFLPWTRKNDGAVINSVDYEPVTFDGASEGGFIYAQTGLYYGHEKHHGKLTGLATT